MKKGFILFLNLMTINDFYKCNANNNKSNFFLNKFKKLGILNFFKITYLDLNK